MLAEAVTEAKFKDFRFYDLRGCFQTRAALGGATDTQIKAAMAHTNGETPTYLLAPLTGAAMKAAAEHAEKEREALTKDEIEVLAAAPRQAILLQNHDSL